MLEYIIYFIITLFATTICSLTGMGGGVIIKPILDVISDFSVHSIGIIASITVFSMAFVSVFKNIKAKTKIPFCIAIPLSIGSIIGGIAGERFVSVIIDILNADSVVKTVQNVVLAFLILWVLIYMNNKNKFKSKKLNGIFPSLLTGLLLGMSSAFLGIGGGPINVSVIVYLFSLSTKTATICSLLTILFSQASKLITITFTTGFSELDFSVVIVMVVAALIGGTIGAYLNRKFSEKTVEKAFNCIVLFVLCLTVFNIFNNLDVANILSL